MTLHPLAAAAVLLLAVAAPPTAGAQRAARDAYFPAPGNGWERRSPGAVGIDSVRLAQAIAFAVAQEVDDPRDMARSQAESFGLVPYGEPIGPFRDRGDPTGIVVRRGYIVAEWGEPERVDMTHSVTKSLLSSVVGVAVDRGLIRSVADTVRGYVGPTLVIGSERAPLQASLAGAPATLELFETPHNRTITWDHLLRQTSDWEGTLWGKPDWADRPSTEPRPWSRAGRKPPGTVYEYNDVRVNVLALAALNVWRRPLPEVLAEHVMDPIGASRTWRWYGYDNSWVLLDGRPVQSVSGGGHWGGGLFISARDQARFGYLTLRRGRWQGRQILSERWVRMALTPTPAQPTYGFMNWFLNTDRKLWPSAPASAFAHLGNGTNLVYVDPEHDVVVVARWIDNASVDGFLKLVLASVEPSR